LGYILDRLLSDEIQEFIFIVGLQHERIQQFVEETYSIKAHYVEQQEPQGLGQAVFLASTVIAEDESFVIVLGDTIYDLDLTPVIQGRYTSIGVKEVADPHRYGVAVLDEYGFVEKMVEKPRRLISRLAIVGVYFIKRAGVLFQCLEELLQKPLKPGEEYQLTDGLQKMLERGEKITTFNVEGWFDCGSKESLLATHRILLEQHSAIPSEGLENVCIVPPVYIHPQAHIRSAVIGPHVSIEEGCRIENAIISDTVVDKKTEIRNMVLSNSIIGHHVTLCGNTNSLNISDHSEVEFF